MATPTDKPPAAPPQEGVALSRDLSLFTITMIGVGGMIGAGIFVLTGIAAGVAGPALVLAFFLNGVVTIFTAMVYAELGSAYPEAGGGYLWVKKGLGGAQGFLAGWMSWFAHAVAGSLYALAFGRFTSEMWFMSGMPSLGLSIEQSTLVFMTLIIVLFAYINYRGASETGTIGNIVTITKVFILALFIAFGLMAMARTEFWITRFTEGFLPNGFGGVLSAMGLTFIAFEGYEIIAQSGEEVINPKRNIPRAIFISIAVVVAIYILVAIVALGAAVPPEGVPAYQYLGEQKEVAIVEVAAQIFPWGIGGIVLLISGVVSTMSALNATTFSSSRVSFAMGRDSNLPSLFARIHPLQHTPHWAVAFSGILMLAMAWSLPIEDVAAAADIMFLLLFLQVNVSVMTLRRKMPELDRGYLMPWFPVVPIVGLVTKAFLAVYLFGYSPIAWYYAIGWIVVGLLAYYAHFSKVEEMEKPSEILMEEVLVSRDYSVVVPVATAEQAQVLGRIGAMLAGAQGGEVLALHVVQVPRQLSLGEGRLLLKDGRAYLEKVIKESKKREVPVHTVIRLGRHISHAVRATALENAADLIVLGWPGDTNTAGRLFGSVIDPIVDNPPTDVAVVKFRERPIRTIKRILVPISEGPNSRKAVSLAVDVARAQAKPADIVLFHVLPEGAREAQRVRAQQGFDYVRQGIEYERIEEKMVENNRIGDAIIAEHATYHLIVMGVSEEPLFRNILVGTLAEFIAQNTTVMTMMVKRRSGRLQSFMRETVLEPTSNGEP